MKRFSYKFNTNKYLQKERFLNRLTDTEYPFFGFPLIEMGSGCMGSMTRLGVVVWTGTALGAGSARSLRLRLAESFVFCTLSCCPAFGGGSVNLLAFGLRIIEWSLKVLPVFPIVIEVLTVEEIKYGERD